MLTSAIPKERKLGLVSRLLYVTGGVMVGTGLGLTNLISMDLIGCYFDKYALGYYIKGTLHFRYKPISEMMNWTPLSNEL